MSIRSKKKMNYYNSQSSHNRHSHRKTTLVADNHLKLVTWIDKSIMFFQETKTISSSDHRAFFYSILTRLERFETYFLGKELITCI